MVNGNVLILIFNPLIIISARKLLVRVFRVEGEVCYPMFARYRSNDY